jgi:hypothetical protein
MDTLTSKNEAIVFSQNVRVPITQQCGIISWENMITKMKTCIVNFPLLEVTSNAEDTLCW